MTVRKCAPARHRMCYVNSFAAFTSRSTRVLLAGLAVMFVYRRAAFGLRRYSRNSLLCFVMSTRSSERAAKKSIEQTWGARCDLLLFIDQDTEGMRIDWDDNYGQVALKIASSVDPNTSKIWRAV